MSAPANPADRAEPDAQARPFVVLAGRSIDLGLDAERVLRVVLENEWIGEPPVDLMRSLGLPEAGAEQNRVLLVRGKEGELPVMARGKVFVRSIGGEALLTLPATVLHGTKGQALWGVVLEEGGRPTLILDPDALRRGVEG